MSLVYGRTLVLSNIREHHGPEVQAFVPGQTGMNYRYDDVDDLTHVISHLIANPQKRRKYAEAGSSRVRKIMGPESMLNGFLDAIHYVHSMRREGTKGGVFQRLQ
jgi:hypothetical protein